jgi:tetratricopeptide (TPR) repeat protein
MKIHLCLLLCAVPALFGVSGCASSSAESSPSQKAAGLGPQSSPKEQLDEERMAAATKGLTFHDGFVRATTSRHDRAEGEALRLQAERVTQERNTWFVSVAAFRDAILADASNAKSYEGLARAFLMEGETERAMPALSSALEIDPKFEQARYLFGMVKQMESDYAGAVAEWETLAQSNPRFRDVYARLAIASYYAHDYPSAWRFLAEAEKRHQDVPGQFRGLLKEADQQP